MKHESDLERKMGGGGTDGVLRPSRIWGDRGGVQPISVSQSLSSLWLITMTHPVLGGVGVQPISTLSSRTQTPPQKKPPKKNSEKAKSRFWEGGSDRVSCQSCLVFRYAVTSFRSTPSFPFKSISFHKATSCLSDWHTFDAS